MKKLIVIFVLFLTAGTINGQKYYEQYPPYETWIKTLKFNVLDINLNKKVIGFKHVYELLPSYTYDGGGENAEKPVDCGYAGMESNPKAGVVLGVYDLEKGAFIKTFTVYKSSFKKSECFKHETSAANLDSAKELFKEYNLDITKKMKPLVFDKKDKKTTSLNLNGINITSSYESNYDEMKSVSNLYTNNKLLYYVEHHDNFAMASHAEIFYTAAYKKGNKVVFLIKYFHTHNMEGPSSYEFHYFSPIFTTANGQLSKE